MKWGLRRLARAGVVAIVAVGGTVVVATPAFAAVNVTFESSGLPAGASVSISGTFSNGGCQHNRPLSASFTSPGPGGSTGMCSNGAGQLNATYPATVTSSGSVYTRQSVSPAMPYALPTTGTPVITGTYALTCEKVAIADEPASLTRTLGESATFTVTATGTALQYQWRKGTTPIEAANSDSYTIPSVTSADAATDYNVVVTQGCAGATPSSATSNNASLTFTKVPTTIAWEDPDAIAYGSALSAIELDASASVPGEFVYSPAAGAILGAGSHTLHADFTPTDTATYENAADDVSLTVTPAELQVTALDSARAYGAENPAFDAAIAGFVNAENDSVLTAAPVCTTTADAASPVGEYPITCSEAAADNYTFSYTAGTLAVTEAPLLVEADDDSRAYGEADPFLTATITGFANGEDESVLTAPPVCTTTADTASPVGEYPITCSDAAATNYTFGYTDGTLTVDPAPLTVEADDDSRAYGEADPFLTATITGFANGEDESVLTASPVCTTTADTASPVGEYPITCSDAAATNYTFGYTDGTLTVDPATLVVTGNDESRTVGAANPALTATITGFVNSEDENVLTTEPTCTTAATPASIAGPYAITCSGASAANYTVNHVDGTLTVTQPTDPVIRGGNASGREGSGAGKKNGITFTLTVSEPVTQETVVNWALADDTAVGGKVTPADFLAKTNGKATFKVGKKVAYINVVLLPDTTVEADETFTVNLSTTTPGIVLATTSLQGTILDDDSTPGQNIGIGDAEVWEGDVGTQAAGGKLWVTLATPAVSTVTVTVAVTGGTATAGKVSPADYKTFKTKVLTFKPGQYKKAVTLQVLADLGVEPNETVIVTLSAASPGVTITKASGTLTILNDD